MATLIGPVPLTPNDREVARRHYSDARHCLRQARTYLKVAESFESDGLRAMASEWYELAVSALSLAVLDRHFARTALRRASGLSGEWGSPWAS